ncbi:DUF4846 domain-containing protein [Niabella drilacis]|uniref:DUF4846 domain-containing protein n=1 Tax=Niabella drilacis (strain DSM 25811 / CCM 8410 / CCUG 62505 / LMG 26954 / E90) TaxID=1285928 RepID=A0A1G6SIG4_NIADE|nr:DUF4846 domain-containing protein [Niabella drilacis]SDD16464.1 protein of unknown function (4846) [Niabella drilacis]
MKLIIYCTITVCCLLGCKQVPSPVSATTVPASVSSNPRSVSAIAPPPGYIRNAPPVAGFGFYLTHLELKNSNTVFLFNGAPKSNQQAQYAVLDISVGDKDLQQCADAVMRLRAEYLFAAKRFEQIRFQSGDGCWISYSDWMKGTRYRLSGRKLVAVRGKPVAPAHSSLLQYLGIVFAYCGTATLPASLYKKQIADMQPGDVLLKPGAPGHAVIVMDMAQNEKKEKIYLLAQSYMPAQDIHILKNPSRPHSSPWYTLNDSHRIPTPEWTFYSNQLYGWK